MRVGIIGGGIIGLACAWRLARDGHDVVLCDANSETKEASWAAAGMLAPHSEAHAPDDLWTLCCASFDLWPQFIEDIGATQQQVDFRAHGSLEPILAGDDIAELEQKVAALNAAGAELRWLAGDEVHQAEAALSPAIERVLFLPGGHVDPRQVSAHLRQRCVEMGVELHYGNAAASINAAHLCLADGQEFDCDQILLAAGAWTPQLSDLCGLTLSGEPVKGQMLAFDADPHLLQHFVHCRHAYLVGRQGTGIVVGSTMEYVGFDHADNPDSVDSLVQGARTVVPALADAPILETWTGLRPRLAGGKPIFARINDHLSMCTGHFRNGILLTPISVAIMAALVNGDEPAYAIDAFDGAEALATK